MKKSFKLFISLFIITAMSLYLAYIDKTIYSVFSEYAEAHLNNPQQYLYIVTIYAMWFYGQSIFLIWNPAFI